MPLMTYEELLSASPVLAAWPLWSAAVGKKFKGPEKFTDLLSTSGGDGN